MKLSLTGMLALALVGSGADAADMKMVGGCIDVSQDHAPIKLAGKLAVLDLPGPPNYESVKRGDSVKRVFMLTLDRDICLFDSDQFADPSVHFRNVHISFEDSAVRARLRRSVGQRVAITGEGFAAFDAHHRAPLVVFAYTVSAQ